MFGFRNLSKDRTEFKSDEHAKNLSHERVSAYLGLGQWTKVGLLEHLAIAFYEVAEGPLGLEPTTEGLCYPAQKLCS